MPFNAIKCIKRLIMAHRLTVLTVAFIQSFHFHKEWFMSFTRAQKVPHITAMFFDLRCLESCLIMLEDLDEG